MDKYDPDKSYILYLIVISYASLKSAESHKWLEFQIILCRVTFPYFTIDFTCITAGFWFVEYVGHFSDLKFYVDLANLHNQKAMQFTDFSLTKF